MPNAIVILGWKSSPSGLVPENLYTGLDGEAAMKAADDARHEGFIKIHKFVNHSGIPLPTDPTPTVSTGSQKAAAKSTPPIKKSDKTKSKTENEKTPILPPPSAANPDGSSDAGADA